MLDLLNTLVYGSLAVVAVAYWVRRRTTPSLWMAVTFAELGAFVVTSAAVTRFVGPTPTDPPPAQFSGWEVYLDLISIAILAFPYLLHRFARSLHPVGPRWAHRTADAGMAVIAVSLLASPALGAAQPSPAEQLYVLALLAWWGILLAWVSASLWRAGAGRPGVVRQRMRLMSLAALLMAVALLVQSALESSVDEDAVRLIGTMFGWGSAVGFLIAFEPPRTLRRLWRTAEEDAQRQAESGLVAALTPTEAARAIVDTARALVGGEAAEVRDGRGAMLATSGDVTAFTRHGVDRADIVLEVASPVSTVRVFRSPVTPVFGKGEEELLRQMCGHLDLALARIAAVGESERARRETERANAELTQLVYGVSHDLRNPLVTVLGFLGLMDDDEGQLSETQAMALERITVSARYMEGLIDDLLQLSRIGRTDSTPSPVELAGLVRDLGDDLQHRYPDLHVEVRSPAVVMMNPTRARQLFTNLVENAARHGRRSPLEVRVTSHRLEDGSVAIDVADNGVGIPAEFHGRVFEIFQRLEGFDAASKGSGIGLTMCRRIVEELGGSLELQKVDSGATFRVLLPPAAVVEHSAAALAHPAPTPRKEVS